MLIFGGVILYRTPIVSMVVGIPGFIEHCIECIDGMGGLDPGIQCNDIYSQPFCSVKARESTRNKLIVIQT